MIEIERKFLVKNDAWPRSESTVEMSQGYMAREGNLVCRVRLKNSTYYLSIKARIDNMSSYDYEYAIPPEDGETMLEKLCDRPPVVKTRHLIEHGDLMWEIDEFSGANTGLVVAEIELPDSDASVVLPSWVGDEVTDDKRYTNYALYCKPYSLW